MGSTSKLSKITILLFCSLMASSVTAAKTNIPFRVDHQAPLNPTESIGVDAADHIQFRVEFNGINADRVPAFLYIPKNEKQQHPAVLLQYGSGGSKKTDYIMQIGRQFAESGFVVLTIDAPYRGERRIEAKDPFLLKQIDYRRFEHYCADYSRAIDYLMQREEVDTNRVGFVGISWGAITGITFVAHDPRIKAMSALVAGGGFPVFLTARDSADPEIARPSLDPADHVANIAPRPLIMINVTLDLLIAPMFSKALHEAAGKNSEVIWYETDHYFNGQDPVKIIQDDVIAFMLKNMPETRRRRLKPQRRIIRQHLFLPVCSP